MLKSQAPGYWGAASPQQANVRLGRRIFRSNDHGENLGCRGVRHSTGTSPNTDEHCHSTAYNNYDRASPAGGGLSRLKLFRYHAVPIFLAFGDTIAYYLCSWPAAKSVIDSNINRLQLDFPI